ncbi:MAG: hypothetical protein ACJ0QP_00310 [Schleiferiaceae bacterium]
MSAKRNSIIAIIGQFFVILLVLYLTPKAISIVDKSNWFHYATGISLIYLSNSFSFGISPKIVRAISRREKIDLVFKKNICLILLIMVISTFVSLCFYLMVAVRYSEEVRMFYLFVIFAFIINFLSIFFRSFLEGKLDWTYVTLFKSFYSISFFLIPILILKSELNIYGLLIFIFSLLNCLFYSLRLFIKYKFDFSWNLRSPIGKEVYELIPLGLFTIINAIYLFGFRFLVALVSENSMISAYTDFVIYEDLFGRQSMVFGSISLVLFPYLVKTKKDLEVIRNKIMISFLGILILSILFAIFGLYWFLNIWLQESFDKQTFIIASVLLPGYTLSTFSIFFIRFFQAKSKEWIPIKVLLISTVYYLISCALVIFYELNLVYLSFTVVSKGVFDIFFFYRFMKNE